MIPCLGKIVGCVYVHVIGASNRRSFTSNASVMRIQGILWYARWHFVFDVYTCEEEWNLERCPHKGRYK